MNIQHKNEKWSNNQQDQETVRKEINILVHQAKAGDHEAAEELITRFKPLIYGTINRHHTGSEWEDLLQSAALSLLEGIQAFDPQKGIPFLAYIKKKLYFDIYNLCRKERNILSSSFLVNKYDMNPLDYIMDETADPLEDILKKEQTESLRVALDQLEPKHRELITLYCFHKLTLKDAAKKMGISYKTAQRYKAKALKCLAGLLGQ